MSDETTTEKKNKGIRAKSPNHGGYRPGAGRPRYRKDSVTIAGILAEVERQSKGKDYEQILIEDFMTARNNNDRALVVKYHQLILQKVMNTLAKIEFTDSREELEAKQAAFAAALSKITGVTVT